MIYETKIKKITNTVSSRQKFILNKNILAGSNKFFFQENVISCIELYLDIWVINNLRIFYGSK